MELFVSDCPRAEQPQCVSRSKLNLRRRNWPRKNNPATEATIASETPCCQFMLATYPQKRFAQPIFNIFPILIVILFLIIITATSAKLA
jgi:hypothetical protein